MNRDLSALEGREFDLVVIGGGIFGACAAWEAARRGLDVALLERGDFCGSTSAHSFKLVHGGIRYFQHGDVRRVRRSSAARRTFLRAAPHLVRPLPVVVPTYGHGARGKGLLSAGMALYDAITWDRNRGIRDDARRVPRSRSLGRSEVLALYPGLPGRGLTGAGVFHDGQLLNPPRLVLAFVRTAVGLGAVAANYVEATALSRDRHRVRGVRARDVLGNAELEIRGRVVLNAAGPHAEPLLRAAGLPLEPSTPWSRDAYFVVARPVVPGAAALALPAATRDPDALVSRGARHLFMVPWRDRTLVGVWHRVYEGEPDDFRVDDSELEAFLAEINGAYGGPGLGLEDVALVNAGLIPFGDNDPAAKDLRFGHGSRLVDHARVHGVDGLFTLIGARFTTAPEDAVQVLDRIGASGRPQARAGRDPEPEPLRGGDFSSFDALVDEVRQRSPASLRPEVAFALAQNHGSDYGRVLACALERPELGRTFGPFPVLQAEAAYAARQEMAQTLADVVLRRTELGSGEYPGRSELESCAAVVGAELGWAGARRATEVESVIATYPAWIRDRIDRAVIRPPGDRGPNEVREIRVGSWLEEETTARRSAQ